MGDVFDQVTQQNPPVNGGGDILDRAIAANQSSQNQSTPQQNSNRDVFDDVLDRAIALNKQQSGQSSQSNSSTASPSSNEPKLSPFEGARTGEGEAYFGPGSFARQFYTGVGKEAAQVGHTVGGLVNKATGNRIPWLPTSTKEPDSLKPQGAAEQEGAFGENIAEFVLTDGALKGMSVLEKLGVAKKISDFAQSSPTVAKLINLGLDSIESAGIISGQDVAHGRPQNAPRDAAIAAATTVGSGAVNAAANKATALWAL